MREPVSGETHSKRRLIVRNGSPAGPRGLPLVGSALEIARTPLGFPERCAREYGDVVRFSIAGRPPSFFLFFPDDVQQVLVEKGRSFRRVEVAPDFGDDIFALEGEAWHRRRRVIATPLSKVNVRGYAETMIDVARTWAGRFEAPRSVDIHREMNAMTLDIVVRTLFHVDPSRIATRLGEALAERRALYYPLFLGWRRLVPAFVPLHARRRLEKLTEEVEHIGLEIIAQHRRAGASGNSLLGRLMEARYEDGTALTDRQLCDEIAALITAGHETTSLTLTAALHLLARHPALLERARDEIAHVLADRPPSPADLERLPFLHAVIREVLRLFPAVPVFGRQALEDVDIGPVRLRKGDEAWIHLWITQRDGRWFDHPREFRPDRWLGTDLEQLPRGAYLPFGAGPRICAGNHFATMELLLTLATLLPRLDLEEDASSEPFTMTHAVILQPQHPVRLRISPR